MVGQLLDDVRGMPGRVRRTGERLRERLDRKAAEVTEKGEAARRWAIRSATLAGARGTDRLWKLHLDTISGAEALLERAPEAPVLGRIKENVLEALTSLEARTTRPPLEGYDGLNVREVRDRLHELDRIGLLQVRHHEAHHKNRKTILDAVDREFEHRERIAGA